MLGSCAHFMLLFLFIFTLAHIRSAIVMNVDASRENSKNITVFGLSGVTLTLEGCANHVIDAGSAKRSSEVPRKATT